MRSIVAAFILMLCSHVLAEPPEFFVFDNGVGRKDWTPEKQAEVLKELGYNGISYNYTNPSDLAEQIKAFNARGLKIYAIYVFVSPDKPEPYDPSLKDAVKMLKGSDTVIWLSLRRVADKSRSYDDDAVRIIREIAGLAEEQGLRVAVYPHAGFYAACADDAVRLTALVDRRNVGASLNLCHEFMSGQAGRLEDTIRKTAPVATLVSINGMDVAKKRYITRLDQGDYDVAAFVKKVMDSGYKGPIGLQCYKVDGDIRENLKLSIEAWKKWALTGRF